MKADIKIELKPFTVPNYVLEPVPREDGTGTNDVPRPLKELDVGAIARMCDDFRASIFKQAGKCDPRGGQNLNFDGGGRVSASVESIVRSERFQELLEATREIARAVVARSGFTDGERYRWLRASYMQANRLAVVEYFSARPGVKRFLDLSLDDEVDKGLRGELPPITPEEHEAKCAEPPKMGRPSGAEPYSCWLIENSEINLCIGMCGDAFKWVAFTDPVALQFARKEDADAVMRLLPSEVRERGVARDHMFNCGVTQ